MTAFVPATATDLFSPFGRFAWWRELLRFLSGVGGVGRGAISHSEVVELVEAWDVPGSNPAADATCSGSGSVVAPE